MSRFAYLARNARGGKAAARAAAAAGRVSSREESGHDDRQPAKRDDRKRVMQAVRSSMSGASEFAHLAPAAEPEKPESLADQIVTAAALARAGGPERPQPRGLAKRIMEAAAKARS